MSVRGQKIVAAMAKRTEEISSQFPAVVQTQEVKEKPVIHNYGVKRGMSRSRYICRNFR